MLQLRLGELPHAALPRIAVSLLQPPAMFGSVGPRILARQNDDRTQQQSFANDLHGKLSLILQRKLSARGGGYGKPALRIHGDYRRSVVSTFRHSGILANALLARAQPKATFRYTAAVWAAVACQVNLAA